MLSLINHNGTRTAAGSTTTTDRAKSVETAGNSSMLHKLKKCLLKRFTASTTSTSTSTSRSRSNNSSTTAAAASSTNLEFSTSTSNTLNASDHASTISWSMVLEEGQGEFIYQNIFSWLDHRSAMKLSMVNRNMRSICTQFHPVGFRMEWWNLPEYKAIKYQQFPFERVVHVHLEGEPSLESLPKQLSWQHVKKLHLNVHYYKNVEECSKIVNFAFESAALLKELVLNSRERVLNDRFTLTSVLDRVNMRGGIKLDRLSTNLSVDINRFFQYEMLSVKKLSVGEHFCSAAAGLPATTVCSTPALCEFRQPSTSSYSSCSIPIISSSTSSVNTTTIPKFDTFRCKVTEKNLKEFCQLITMPQFCSQVLEISLSPSIIVPEVLSTLIDLLIVHLKHVKKIALASSLDPLLLKRVLASFRTTPDNFVIVPLGNKKCYKK